MCENGKPFDISSLLIYSHFISDLSFIYDLNQSKEEKTMLAIRLLQENGTGPDISWLVWVVLICFVFMVFLGWWASKRLSKDEEPVESQTHMETAHVEQEAVSGIESASAVAVVPDDLTMLEGIGPKVAQVLEGIGITTFAALAKSDSAQVQEALNAAGYKYMDPRGWIEQADLVAKGDSERLKKLQDLLKGGRRR
jgi:predicted flap endonuclease-1-like 5' DNA nuclease